MLAMQEPTAAVGAVSVREVLPLQAPLVVLVALTTVPVGRTIPESARNWKRESVKPELLEFQSLPTLSVRTGSEPPAKGPGWPGAAGVATLA
jgi:hypothetical protein